MKQMSWQQARSAIALFDAHATRTPSAIAVIDEAGAASFATLSAEANRLAHTLIARGVRADVAVGLCVSPSRAWVTGVLGIWKAGGAYVPLDPAQPATRLAQVIAAARVAVIVTEAALIDRLPADGRVETIDLDADAPLLAQASSTNPARPLTPAQLAYILYTSGSNDRLPIPRAGG